MAGEAQVALCNSWLSNRLCPVQPARLGEGCRIELNNHRFLIALCKRLYNSLQHKKQRATLALFRTVEDVGEN